MAKQSFTGVTCSYIFDEASGMRDQLEQTILEELKAKEYPLKAAVKEITAGGIFFGTKEQCVVIEVDNEAQIAIASTAVGSYLYVEAHLMVQEKSAIFAALSALTDNAFKQQKRNAMFAAARQSMETAFAMLKLKQSNSGYIADKEKTKSEN